MSVLLWIFLVIVIIALPLGLYFGLRDTSDIVFYSDVDQKGTASARWIPVDAKVNDAFGQTFDFNVKSVKFNKPNYKIDFLASTDPMGDNNKSLGSLTATGNTPKDVSSKYVLVTKTA
jgi:hypothetical protein